MLSILLKKVKLNYSKNMLKRFLFIFTFATGSFVAQAQTFTRQDSLRGSITPERAWWDLTFYQLNLKADPDAKTLKGSNTIHYKVLKPAQVMQIDLQPPMKLEKALQNGKELAIKTEG